MDELNKRLEEFASQQNVSGKGPLAIAVQLTRAFSNFSLPLDPNDFVTDRGGQVKFLGGPNLAKILKDHGISRRLASEGGRTSRGGHSLMRVYVAFINQINNLGLLKDWNSLV